MSERAASEESDERALLYEMWCTLSRVHQSGAFIKVINLKIMITAILGFPIAVHEDPNSQMGSEHKSKRKAGKKGGKEYRMSNLAEIEVDGEPDQIDFAP